MKIYISSSPNKAPLIVIQVLLIYTQMPIELNEIERNTFESVE